MKWSSGRVFAPAGPIGGRSSRALGLPSAGRPGPGREPLDAQSSEQAARGRALLEAALGDAVRYRLTTSQGIEPALAEAEDRGPTRRREPEIPAEVQQQIVGEFLGRHYRSWDSDSAIPPGDSVQ